MCLSTYGKGRALVLLKNENETPQESQTHWKSTRKYSCPLSFSIKKAPKTRSTISGYEGSFDTPTEYILLRKTMKVANNERRGCEVQWNGDKDPNLTLVKNLKSVQVLREKGSNTVCRTR